MTFDSIEEWVASIPRDFLRIDHLTGWSESVGIVNDEKQTYFAFVTLDGAKARRAIELLGAAGLLCESPTGHDDGDECLPHLEYLQTYPIAAIVDCVRALAGTPLVRAEPLREEQSVAVKLSGSTA